MTASVIQTSFYPFSWAGTGNVSLAAVAADSLLVCFIYGEGGDIGSTPSFTADGVPIDPIWTYSTTGAQPGQVGFWWFSGVDGVTALGVTVAAPGLWTVGVVELGGGAVVEEDIRSSLGGAAGGGNPVTPAWTSPDVGVEVCVVVAEPAETYVEPAGWTLLYGATAADSNFILISRNVTAGAVAGEAFTGAVATSYLSLSCAIFDLGLRISDSFAVGAANRATVAIPGSTPAPNPVTPFIPEVNPLAPNPEEIQIPLDPAWVPRPGPYRYS